jgi:serine protease inhibitor
MAPATGIGPVREKPPEPQPEPFHIDRPCLFLIADRTTGAVLFEGHIVDPRS